MKTRYRVKASSLAQVKRKKCVYTPFVCLIVEQFFEYNETSFHWTPMTPPSYGLQVTYQLVLVPKFTFSLTGMFAVFLNVFITEPRNQIQHT